MIYRKVPRAGIELSAIGLGGHEYLPDGRLRGFQEDFARATTPGEVFAGFGGEKRRKIVKIAYDRGINFYDVTQDSEKEALGRNLREMPPPFEVYVQTRPEQMMYDRDPGNRKMSEYPLLRAEVERILKLMGRPRLDFLNLGISPQAWRSDAEYLPRLRATIEQLKKDGLIRFATADTFRGQETYLQMIASGGFDSIFINLNLADRAGRERVLPAAREQGLAVLGREVFMKGELFKMGEEVGLTDRTRLAQAALQWVLSVPELTCMVIGAAEPEHLEKTLAALEAPGLSAEAQGMFEQLRTSPLYKAFETQRQQEFLAEATPARI